MEVERETHTVTMAEVMTPDKANFSGKVHGGHLMSMLDRVAYACAARYAGAYIVTLSVDQVMFKKPIFVGELVTCYAAINFVGRTSMEVGIKVVSENFITKELRHTNTCYFTMVSVDENGKPEKLPPFTPVSAEQKRRFSEAKIRREIRFEMEKEQKLRRDALKGE